MANRRGGGGRPDRRQTRSGHRLIPLFQQQRSENTLKISPASLAKFDAWVLELCMLVPVVVIVGAGGGDAEDP